jgi:hypothetical protein
MGDGSYRLNNSYYKIDYLNSQLINVGKKTDQIGQMKNKKRASVIETLCGVCSPCPT